MRYLVVDENNLIQHVYEIDQSVMSLSYMGHTSHAVNLSDEGFQVLLQNPGKYAYENGSIVKTSEVKHNKLEGEIDGTN